MKKIILYGAGYYGQMAHNLYGDRVAFFCDARSMQGEIMDIPVIDFSKLLQIYSDYEIIVTPIDANARKEIASNLEEHGIPFTFFDPKIPRRF